MPLLLALLLLATPERPVQLPVGGFAHVKVDDLEKVEVDGAEVVQAVRVGSDVVELAGASPGRARVIALTRGGLRVVFAVTVGQPPPAPPAKPRVSARVARQTRALREQAEAAQKAGQPAQAEQALRQALALDPGDAQAHRLLGSALLAQEQQAAAAAEYRRFLELAPDDPQAGAIRRVLTPFEKAR